MLLLQRFSASANNRWRRHYGFRLSGLSPAIRYQLFYVTRYLYTYWSDLNETCHKYSSS